MKREKTLPPREPGRYPAKKRQDMDKRVNAPLISVRSYFSIFLAVYLLIVGQAFILAQWLDNTLTLIGVLVYYTVLTCLVIALFLGILKRHFYGRPLRKIARAARQIAGGNYDVRVESFRSDGKKDEIEVLIEDFNKMAEELSSVEMLKGNFIANVSHEIKTPLSIFQSYSQALKDHSLSDEQRDEYADALILASQNLNAMITNILKLNKLENQEIHPAPRPYQLGEQLRHCALAFMDEWQKKGLDFQIDVADVAVNYDASMLELVWNNLIANAIKFTEPGGSISLTSAKEDDRVLITIRDTGCGIEPDARSKIFDKFYQGDTSHSTQGNGLGLSLVKKVLEVVGGDISVESKPNEGTAFTVTLSTLTE